MKEEMFYLESPHRCIEGKYIYFIGTKSSDLKKYLNGGIDEKLLKKECPSFDGEKCLIDEWNALSSGVDL